MNPRRSDRLERRRQMTSENENGPAFAPSFDSSGQNGYDAAGGEPANMPSSQQEQQQQQQQQHYQHQQPQQQQYYQQQQNPYAAQYMARNAPPPMGSEWCPPYPPSFPPAAYMSAMPMPMPQFPPFPYPPPFPPFQPAAPFFASPPPFTLPPTTYTPPAMHPTGHAFVPTRQESTASSAAVPQPTAPVATDEYLEQSHLKPIPTSSPRPLLVILDLNGTLIHRKRRGHPVSFVKRPGLDAFLDVLFNTPELKVMVWSSARPNTVLEVLDRLLEPAHRRKLVASWTRTTLDLTKQQYRDKVQVYKRLDKIWNDPTIQAAYPQPSNNNDNDNDNDQQQQQQQPAPKWDQTNTLLIDDNATKCINHPHNIIEIPEFTNDRSVDEDKNLHTVIRQLQLLRYQADVSRKLHQWAGRRHEDTTTVNIAAVDGFWQRELRLEELALEARKTMPSNAGVKTGAADTQGTMEIAAVQRHSTDDTEKETEEKKEEDEDKTGNTAPSKPSRTQKRAERRRRHRFRHAEDAV